MGNLNGFNAGDYEDMQDFSPMPEGRYTAIIESSKMKDTKAGTGQYLEITFQVLEPTDYSGRKLFSRLNIVNPNPKAVQIAKGELSSICRAVDVISPGDSSALHNIPMVIKIKCEKSDYDDKIYNVIKGYYSINSTSKPVATPVSGPVTDTAVASTPPTARGDLPPGYAPWAKD